MSARSSYSACPFVDRRCAAVGHVASYQYLLNAGQHAQLFVVVMAVAVAVTVCHQSRNDASELHRGGLASLDRRHLRDRGIALRAWWV